MGQAHPARRGQRQCWLPFSGSGPNFPISMIPTEVEWARLTPLDQFALGSQDAGSAGSVRTHSESQAKPPVAKASGNAAAADRKAVPPSLAEINKYYLDQNT